MSNLNENQCQEATKVSRSLGEFYQVAVYVALTTATMYDAIFSIEKMCKGSNNK